MATTAAYILTPERELFYYPNGVWNGVPGGKLEDNHHHYKQLAAHQIDGHYSGLSDCAWNCTREQWDLARAGKPYPVW